MNFIFVVVFLVNCLLSSHLRIYNLVSFFFNEAVVSRLPPQKVFILLTRVRFIGKCTKQGKPSYVKWTFQTEDCYEIDEHNFNNKHQKWWKRCYNISYHHDIVNVLKYKILAQQKMYTNIKCKYKISNVIRNTCRGRYIVHTSEVVHHICT